MESESLEPHGLPSPKAHLCAYGYTVLKNALAVSIIGGGIILAIVHTRAVMVCSAQNKLI